MKTVTGRFSKVHPPGNVVPQAQIPKGTPTGRLTRMEPEIQRLPSEHFVRQEAHASVRLPMDWSSIEKRIAEKYGIHPDDVRSER
jgi:soluble lytic murein transglycosylase-like protein